MSNNYWKIATLALGVIVLSIISFVIYHFASNRISYFANKNNLNIKAAIVYNFGGAQPVARTNFYLLREDLNVIARNAGIGTGQAPLSLDLTADDLQSKLTNKPSRLMQAMGPSVVKSAATDFQGNASFEDVPTGNYFIYGRTETRNGWAIWDYKISVDKSATILLDQNNAIIAE